MQQADGPPEQVDQWRLVIDDPERIEWRRAWLTGSRWEREPATSHRRYQAVVVQKNDLSGEWGVVRTDNTAGDLGVSFTADSEREVGAASTRDDAVELAVEEMVTSRDVAGNVDETTQAAWVQRRRPEPDFTGQTLTDF